MYNKKELKWEIEQTKNNLKKITEFINSIEKSQEPIEIKFQKTMEKLKEHQAHLEWGADFLQDELDCRN